MVPPSVGGGTVPPAGALPPTFPPRKTVCTAAEHRRRGLSRGVRGRGGRPLPQPGPPHQDAGRLALLVAAGRESGPPASREFRPLRGRQAGGGSRPLGGIGRAAGRGRG